jgi:outer membrane biosynthesis protein TonB
MARKAQIVQCFENQLAHDPTLSGKVLIKFSIDASGKVSRSAMRSTSLRNDVVENCVNAEVVKAVFPPLKTGRFAIVQYPFEFPFP